MIDTVARRRTLRRGGITATTFRSDSSGEAVLAERRVCRVENGERLRRSFARLWSHRFEGGSRIAAQRFPPLGKEEEETTRTQ